MPGWTCQGAETIVDLRASTPRVWSDYRSARMDIMLVTISPDTGSCLDREGQGWIKVVATRRGGQSRDRRGYDSGVSDG